MNGVARAVFIAASIAVLPHAAAPATQVFTQSTTVGEQMKKTDPSGDPRYLSIKGAAWRLCLADVNGDGSNEIVYGAYDGAVRCVDPLTGTLLWEHPTAGFPYCIAAHDINGDGRDEIFCAAGDGVLYAFSADGALLWTYCGDAARRPLYNVAVGTLDPRGVSIVCGGIDRRVTVLAADGTPRATYNAYWLAQRLVLLDADGDGYDEIMFADQRTTLDMLKLERAGLRSLWRSVIVPPERRARWDNPGGNVHVFSLATSAQFADVHSVT